jgi:hypothetical protein
MRFEPLHAPLFSQKLRLGRGHSFRRWEISLASRPGIWPGTLWGRYPGAVILSRRQSLSLTLDHLITG